MKRLQFLMSLFPNITAILLGLGLATSAFGQVILLDNFNSGTSTGSVLAGTSWVGQVTANPTTITIGGTATDVNGWRAIVPEFSASGMNYISIIGQRDAGHDAAASFTLQLVDADSKWQVFSVSTSLFAIGTLTQVQIPIDAWDAGFNPFRVTEWTIGGGSTGLLPFRMTLDNLSLSASAIPEPSTYALLSGVVSLGLVAVVRIRRRKRLPLG